MQSPETLAFIVKKDKTDERMTKEFLLHKDKEENMEIYHAQMAHLVFADTQPNAKKTKRAISFQRTQTDRQ